jgi:hypothetical protein
MSPAPNQAIITAVVKVLADAPEELREVLEPYPDARIIAITQKSNWVTSFSGETALLDAIEYAPAETASP